jgi:hypothetical protein
VRATKRHSPPNLTTLREQKADPAMGWSAACERATAGHFATSFASRVFEGLHPVKPSSGTQIARSSALALTPARS